MSVIKRPTLTQYLIEQRRRYPEASGELNGLVLDVANACKIIARAVACGELGDRAVSDPGQAPAAGQLNVHGEVQKRLDVLSHEIFVATTEWAGHLAGMVSEEAEQPLQIPAGNPRGKYLLVFDPLDGSGNLDVDVSVGSIFSILRAPPDAVATGRDVTEADFLQPGSQQVAAGYALYGPSTMFVLSVGNGVAGFTLDQDVGEFRLTHPELRVPEDTREFAINTSNSRFWEAPVKRYVDECLAGSGGPRGKDFNMRWIASMVAEAHRILIRGGVFLYPRDRKIPERAGRLRLLYEANPIGFLMEQAGGRASTGRQAILGLQPSALHQRIALVFGSRHEVERIESFHHDVAHSDDEPHPLFAQCGLFRA
jgi:fructose-1,6-bisphosphatase I/sedoheptulose-1,7-bisphosphatase